ncbi:unnamed protein product [Coregonus sp. 'balchen']|nr:unnamed protein product [Coregonus sp. 'balchen']
MTEWLKNNIWLANQVAEYMKENAFQRTPWIRQNGAWTVEIVREYPRLLDIPGMGITVIPGISNHEFLQLATNVLGSSLQLPDEGIPFPGEEVVSLSGKKRLQKSASPTEGKIPRRKAIGVSDKADPSSSAPYAAAAATSTASTRAPLAGYSVSLSLQSLW